MHKIAVNNDLERQVHATFVTNYIPVRHDMMCQTNDRSPDQVMQQKVMYFDSALGPAALGLDPPTPVVQPCPKPRPLIHKPFLVTLGDRDVCTLFRSFSTAQQCCDRIVSKGFVPKV